MVFKFLGWGVVVEKNKKSCLEFFRHGASVCAKIRISK